MTHDGCCRCHTHYNTHTAGHLVWPQFARPDSRPARCAAAAPLHNCRAPTRNRYVQFVPTICMFIGKYSFPPSDSSIHHLRQRSPCPRPAPVSSSCIPPSKAYPHPPKKSLLIEHRCSKFFFCFCFLLKCTLVQSILLFFSFCFRVLFF